MINSAAENLADGIVATPEQVKSYGSLIRHEGQRLTEMVEQTLLFAAGSAARHRYNLQPVEVAAVVDRTLAEAQPMLRAAGLSVDKEVEPDLPLVRADAAALGRCLHSLITNAVRYAATGRRLAIRAALAAAGRDQYEVQIGVRDYGPGIDPADFPNIFEPFYRGRPATETGAHGAGLGLSLTRETMETMGGRVTATSTPGEGSTFTLHLAAANGAGPPSGGDGPRKL